ncbi:hypothetical protein AD948_04410 [Acetobacter senegalensis]|uniref:Uncharacterized protein n=2 Tax=Acetobacter senegalensis TaxID=446692 RepID=A0A149U5C5_9PROT|nr:hypothetical protein AD948_04410 [Acetobacter senegalensis]
MEPMMILYPRHRRGVTVVTLSGSIALLAQAPGGDSPRFIRARVSSLRTSGLMIVALFDGVPNIDPALEQEADMETAIKVVPHCEIVSVSARYAWPVEDAGLGEWFDRIQEGMSHF